MTETASANDTQNGANYERHGFQAEVAKLLHMMVHSVYSEREIFLRELISNASDACDKLRYESLTQPNLLDDGGKTFAIDIVADAKAGTLTVTDNGVGMSKQELIENLGTIARSGTSAFVSKLTGDAKKDVSQIGQFGVGFYSVFMVADRVSVTSRRAGQDDTWVWESEGTGEFSLHGGERPARGTTITLHIKDDAKEFLEKARLSTIVKTYSNHIPVAITLKIDDGEAEQVNSGSALWTRSKSDITDDQYKEFYHHVAHAFDDPALTLHYRAEGTLEYSVLLFVPTRRPMDLYDPARKSRVKLFVKRVFITDDCEAVLPPYLRFLRGVIDSQDLPLNISREMLQNNPVLAKMRKAVTNRVLTELEKKAESDADGFATIWEAFGPVIKEGIYEDFERRDQILKLARFRSTTQDGWTTLADYITRMKPDQKAIYTITGDNLDAARRSPHLEGFKAKGVEVLLLSDPVDDFWLTSVPEFDGKPLKSVTRGGSDLADLAGGDDSKTDADKKDPAPAGLDALIAALKDHLKDAIKDVRTTDRLTDSPVCLVADDGDMDMHIARILQQSKQLGAMSPRILELNPKHALVKALAARAEQGGALDALSDAAHLLHDQALILEGESLSDPAEFSRRLTAVMTQAFG